MNRRNGILVLLASPESTERGNSAGARAGRLPRWAPWALFGIFLLIGVEGLVLQQAPG